MLASVKRLSLLLLQLSSFIIPASTNPVLVPRATVPGPPADPPQQPGDGSGQFNTIFFCNARDIEVELILQAGVVAFAGKGWIQASRTMQHCLNAAGTDLSVNVANMWQDNPAFKDAIHALAQVEAKKAVEDVVGPWVTRTFTSTWKVWHAWNTQTNQPYSYDWYYALGEYSYAVSGVIAKDSKGVMTLQWKAHVFDRYNWDNSNKTQNLGWGITLSHEEIGHLHKCGSAREYVVRGTSKEQVVRAYDSKKPLPPVDY